MESNLVFLIFSLIFGFTSSDVSVNVNFPPCTGSAKYPVALFCDQYYECIQVSTWWILDQKRCPTGQYFDTTTGTCLPAAQVDCGTRRTTRTTTTTTISQPITVPDCSAPTKHPALLCYQYFECVRKLWWYEPKLKTCPNGQAFDRFTNQCVCAGSIGCELRLDPNCYGPGKLSYATCKQYYECTQKWWWWEPTLKECSSGQSYDALTCQCVDDSFAVCTTKPTCYGWAKYPSDQKNQYYECMLDSTGLNWVPVLKTCYYGYVFDLTRDKCVFNIFK